VSFGLLYLAVYHVLVPFGKWCVWGWQKENDAYNSGSASVWDSWGFSRSSNNGKAILARLEHDQQFEFARDLDASFAKKLQKERERWQKRSAAKGQRTDDDQNTEDLFEPRSSVLEAIAPLWYHRYDPPGTVSAAAAVVGEAEDGDRDGGEDDEVPSEDAHNEKGDNKNSNNDDGADGDDAMNKENGQKENGNEDEHNSNNDYDGADGDDAMNNKGDDVSHSRILAVTGGIANDKDVAPASTLLPLRTLHNQRELAKIHSSCGKINGKSQLSTTLVVQTSIDRLWILRETCAHRWTTDPIVAVVFVPQDSSALLLGTLDTTAAHLVETCPHLTLVRYEADVTESKPGRYPVNRMRNVGLDRVTTSHVLTIDVDLVPSHGLDQLIRDRAFAVPANTNTKTNTSGNKRNGKDDRKQRHPPMALVVPAFERKPPSECDDAQDRATCLSAFLQADGSFLPSTFAELKDCYTKGSKDCVVFQSEFNWDGHSTTRSEEWVHEHWYDDENENENENEDENENENENENGDESESESETDDKINNNADSKSSGLRSFRKIACFHTPRYEPYVVLEWCPQEPHSSSSSSSSYSSSVKNESLLPIAPYYDERFFGYGKNKIELVSHLRRSGYEFRVLPEGFIVHNPHPESATKETWNTNGGDQKLQLHSTMDALYQAFMKELDKYHEIHDSTVKLCLGTHGR